MTDDSMPQSQNPYIGPYTFQRGDRFAFFGRDLEARELLALVTSNRLVLFYAESGAGKSSLINKCLIPDLEKSGFEVLPVGRVGGTPPTQVENPFVHNLMLSLLGAGKEESHQWADLPLSAFLIGLDSIDGEQYYHDADREGLRQEDDLGLQSKLPASAKADLAIWPRALIIDQFEEILTTNLQAWNKRAGFFDQLRGAMEDDPYLWVVLTLREDYVAGLDPYARLLPGDLRSRYYMRRLGPEAASQAINKPAEMGGRPFDKDAADRLVKDLSRIRIPGDETTHPGQFIDPILLQIVCHQLWENLRDKPPGTISLSDLRQAGEIGTALRRYYEDAIREVINKFKISEQLLRNWFEEQLITPDKTRNLVREEDTQTAGLENAVIRVLARQFVLRPMVRSGTTWYELAHDRLVDPILDANREWKEDNQVVDREWMAKEGVAREFTNPYEISSLRSLDSRRTHALLMPIDIYLQAGSEMDGIPAVLNTVYVAREPDLMPGPTSARIAVVDYDSEADRLEEPVQWDARKGRFVLGHNGDKTPITRAHRELPQFHQVNVWATIQNLLHMYEASWVLGRSAPWAFEGNRLIVVPHAGYASNAFYDRQSKSMQFYYSGPESERAHTCLSHDIIAHETGHAIMDGLRPYYYEDSSVQTTAFHEFVADLTAILSLLIDSELRRQVEGRFDGYLSKDTIEAILAEELGRYATGRLHFRSAFNWRTTQSVAGSIRPCDWAQVLTGAMFDILRGMIVEYIVKDRADGKQPSWQEATLSVLDRYVRLALQPLDYLPPADVQFSDYARAVLRVDELIDPVDMYDFRGLMKEVFAKRGIDFAPDEVESANPSLYESEIDRVARSRTDACHFLNENRRQLCIPADQDLSVLDLYQTAKTIMGGTKLPHETVLQYAWREDIPLKGPEFGRLDGETTSMICGGTLVFDDRGNVLHWVRKPGSRAQKISAGRRRNYCGAERANGMERRKQILEYVARRVQEGYVGLVESEGQYEMGLMPPVAATRGEDGILQFEVSPHLRHWSPD